MLLGEKKTIVVLQYKKMIRTQESGYLALEKQGQLLYCPTVCYIIEGKVPYIIALTILIIAAKQKDVRD